MTVEELRAEARKLGYKIVKVNPPRVAKYNKCRDCKYLTGIESTIGVECMNENKQFRTNTARFKYPCAKACKLYEEGDNK